MWITGSSWGKGELNELPVKDASGYGLFATGLGTRSTLADVLHSNGTTLSITCTTRSNARARNVRDSAGHEEIFGYRARTDGVNKLGRTEMCFGRHCGEKESILNRGSTV